MEHPRTGTGPRRRAAARPHPALPALGLPGGAHQHRRPGADRARGDGGGDAPAARDGDRRDGSPHLPPATELVEPLRITLQSLDLEALTKVWTAAAQPLRLSVGYEVSLVVVEQQARMSRATGRFRPDLRRLARRPAGLGRAPTRIGADPHLVRVPAGRRTPRSGSPPRRTTRRGPGRRLADDRAGTGRRHGALQLPQHDLRPGVRRLDAVSTMEGLPAGRDSIGLTVVPPYVALVRPPPAGSAVVRDHRALRRGHRGVPGRAGGAPTAVGHHGHASPCRRRPRRTARGHPPVAPGGRPGVRSGRGAMTAELLHPAPPQRDAGHTDEGLQAALTAWRLVLSAYLLRLRAAWAGSPPEGGDTDTRAAAGRDRPAGYARRTGSATVRRGGARGQFHRPARYRRHLPRPGPGGHVDRCRGLVGGGRPAVRRRAGLLPRRRLPQVSDHGTGPPAPGRVRPAGTGRVRRRRPAGHGWRPAARARPWRAGAADLRGPAPPRRFGAGRTRRRVRHRTGPGW